MPPSISRYKAGIVLFAPTSIYPSLKLVLYEVYSNLGGIGAAILYSMLFFLQYHQWPVNILAIFRN